MTTTNDKYGNEYKIYKVTERKAFDSFDVNSKPLLIISTYFEEPKLKKTQTIKLDLNLGFKVKVIINQFLVLYTIFPFVSNCQWI